MCLCHGRVFLHQFLGTVEQMTVFGLLQQMRSARRGEFVWRWQRQRGGIGCVGHGGFWGSSGGMLFLKRLHERKEYDVAQVVLAGEQRDNTVI
jgi:hypothetical protein